MPSYQSPSRFVEVAQPATVFTSTVTATIPRVGGIFYGITVTNLSTVAALVGTVTILNVGAPAPTGSILGVVVAPLRSTTPLILPYGVRFSTLVVSVLGSVVYSVNFI